MEHNLLYSLCAVQFQESGNEGIQLISELENACTYAWPYQRPDNLAYRRFCCRRMRMEWLECIYSYQESDFLYLFQF